MVFHHACDFVAPSSGAITEARALLDRLVTEAENAFQRAPKAMWSDRTYLAPKDAAKLKAMLSRSALEGA
jgi:hypothetical protein